MSIHGNTQKNGVVHTMSKSSKHLYACGCSYTEENWHHKKRGLGPHTMWPAHLGEKLGLDVVNLGEGGMGNDYILTRSTRYILDNHKNIEIVAIAWSEAHRFSLYETFHFNPTVWLEGSNEDWDTKPRNLGYIWQEQPYSWSKHLMKHMNDFEQYGFIFKKYLREIYTIQRLCEELNLKYIFFGALAPIIWAPHERYIGRPNLKKELYLNQFIDSEYFSKINKKNFIGWPVDENLGGHPTTKYLTEEYRLSDGHPNAEGQKLIAKKAYDFYKGAYK